MTTARTNPQLDSPKIYHALSDVRRCEPNALMWIAVIELAIFDATRKVEINMRKATPGVRKWRAEEYRNRCALKRESRKWLRRGCADTWGHVNVLALLGIEPSWFHKIVRQAHPELR